MDAREKHVLLVANDRTVRSIYARLLQNHGFCVCEETSIVDALDRIINGQHFDLVIVDIMLAKSNGWGFLGAIRDTLRLDSLQLPVIVMSAHFDSDMLRLEAFRRGASAAYMKTEPMSKLLKAVRIHTGRQRSRYDDDTVSD